MHKTIATAIAAALAGTAGALAPAHHAAAAPPQTHKVFAPKSLAPAGAQAVESYGRFGLYRVDAATLSSMQAASPRVRADAEADSLLFSAYPFDTQRGTLQAPAPFALRSAQGPRLDVVQFVGPIKQQWLDALKARGIQPVQYVANNGYLVWVDIDAQPRLEQLRTDANWLQFASPFYGFLKVDPKLGAQLAQAGSGGDEVDVVVQVYRHDGVAATRRFVETLGLVPTGQLGPLGPGKATYAWAGIADRFENLELRVRVSDIPAIAERPDVTFVGAVLPVRLLDEKQDLIMTGDFAPGTGSIDYLQFLLDRGFSQDPADYPIVDLTDSTIDEGGTGVTAVNTADPRLHVGGDVANPSRVAYFRNCSTTADTSVGAIDGHGSLNAGIVAGYDQTAGTPYQDADGHQLGLGVNPFGRVGSTALFTGSGPSISRANCGGNDAGVILANWQNGARISNNSWGSTFPPSTYDAGQQAYDAGVRDADPGSAGNQEMIYVFSAGNSGPDAASVGSPGAAKNTIVVGASENLRPYSGVPDHCELSGVAVATAADDPTSVADFSSRGPSPGQRVKPEVIAPGSHITSGASIYSGYTGSGVCSKYYPTGQTIFAASTGTSHSAPAVAGLASLSYYWIEHGGVGAAAGTVDVIGGARAPSPAAMKAWLIAHPSYLTGVDGNDDLPSNNQGYGMPNIDTMFDATPKIVLDQSETFDDTGDTRSYTWSVADPTKPVRVVLAYTDAFGALGTSPQVNDLDLAVDTAGATYLGNHFASNFSTTGGSADTRNNYEAVFLPAGATDLTITVTAANIAGDGVPGSGDATDQDFALVCSNCVRQPTFTVSTPALSAEVCSGTDFSAPIAIGSIQGYDTPVALALSGAPAGASAAVTPTNVTPPGNATVSVTGSDAVAAGDYTLTLTGTSGTSTKSLAIDLTYATTAPSEPALQAPADGAPNQSQTPVLSWQAAAQAGSYRVEVASDAAFSTLVASATVADTSWTVAPALNSNTRYYWRVTALNACGDSGGAGGDRIFGDGFDETPLPPLSQSFVFTTQALPGDCSIGSTQQVLWSDDLEGDTNGWSHSGTQDSWTLGANAHGGTHAWQANNTDSVSDQRLVSPSVALPGALTGLTLSFWNRQSLEASFGGGCFDAAILEVSSDDGASWTPLPSTSLLTDPYDGAVDDGYDNPLAGEQAWCGDPQSYLNSIVDIQSHAGQTVKFRFRMANDNSGARANPGWAIDDLRVAGCQAD
ncbi:S8 family serine peptidase [Dokdonella sp.]|uniref:S8 family serine peptidase n=1 Tax=Dokdonella sp. TaxID=2291710 RepID=UPI001B00BD26|nr:S8 family serine peptidase [Dokdonella sp.]MBO9663365.1 S8 family serine peptidase [Dokdonella sp.]